MSSLSNNRFVLHDYILSKAVVFEFNKNGDSLKEIIYLDKNSFNPKTLLKKKKNADTVLYNYLKKDIKLLHFNKASLENYTLSDSSLHILVKLYMPEISLKDTSYVMNFFMFENNFYNGTKTLKYINSYNTIGKDTSIDFNNIRTFYVRNKEYKFIVDVGINNKDDSTIFLSNWKSENNEIVYKKLETKFKKSVFKRAMNDSSEYLVNTHFYFFGRTPIFLNLDNKIMYSIDKLFSRGTEFRDVIQVENNFKVLSIEKGKVFVNIIDIKSLALKNKTEIKLLGLASIYFCKFYDKNTLCYFDTKITTVFLQKID